MSREVVGGIWVGDDRDCPIVRRPAWSCVTPDVPRRMILHACKHPCHQWIVGYKGSLSPHHPEYLWARREDGLALNMIDAPLPKFFPPDLFSMALSFISAAPRPLLIHCNDGRSRAPSLLLLWLAVCERQSPLYGAPTFAEAERRFLELYPAYAPAAGIRARLTRDWAASWV